ncbi:hypothetical protein HID58_069945, partial [Brassica napus]
ALIEKPLLRLPSSPLLGAVAGKLPVMMKIRTPKTHKAKRVLEQRVPKLKGGAIKYSRRNENIRPFESGGETSLEFFSLKTDCSIFAVSLLQLCFVALTIGNLCIHLVYVIFVPPAPLHPHIYSNGHICLGISLSISFCFFTLCIMFFVLFLVSLCWMLLSAV